MPETEATTGTLEKSQISDSSLVTPPTPREGEVPDPCQERAGCIKSLRGKKAASDTQPVEY